MNAKEGTESKRKCGKRRQQRNSGDGKKRKIARESTRRKWNGMGKEGRRDKEKKRREWKCGKGKGEK